MAIACSVLAVRLYWRSRLQWGASLACFPHYREGATLRWVRLNPNGGETKELSSIRITARLRLENVQVDVGSGPRPWRLCRPGSRAAWRPFLVYHYRIVATKPADVGQGSRRNLHVGGASCGELLTPLRNRSRRIGAFERSLSTVDREFLRLTPGRPSTPRTFLSIYYAVVYGFNRPGALALHEVAHGRALPNGQSHRPTSSNTGPNPGLHWNARPIPAESAERVIETHPGQRRHHGPDTGDDIFLWRVSATNASGKSPA